MSLAEKVVPEEAWSEGQPWQPVPTPSRFRNALSKYRVWRDESKCIKCGKCVEVCPYGVHTKSGSYIRRPKSHLCLGFACQEKEFYCVDKCPVQALKVSINPMYGTLGDRRWPGDLLLSTWWQAEWGNLPYIDLESRLGESGGGFDKLRFLFPKHRPDFKLSHDDISLEVEINKRGDGRPQIKFGVPWYGGGMSFGSVSISTILSRIRAAIRFDTMVSTGEGGFPEDLYPYDDHIITQVATGLFGVREDTIQRVRIVEFKYAQGAKPGLGGHLLGTRLPQRGRMREAVVGSALFSPFPFHSVYSVEDHKKHVDWIKEINPGPWYRSRSPLRRTWTWWRWAATTPAPTSSIWTAATAAPAPLRTSPRKTSPCPSNTRFPRCTSSSGRGHPRPGHPDRQRRYPHAPSTWPRPSPWGPTGW